VYQIIRGINGVASLLSVYLSSCPSLGLAHGVESMPLSLEELDDQTACLQLRLYLTARALFPYWLVILPD
jgi:hypothetical protein